MPRTHLPPTHRNPLPPQAPPAYGTLHGTPYWGKRRTWITVLASVLAGVSTCIGMIMATGILAALALSATGNVPQETVQFESSADASVPSP